MAYLVIELFALYGFLPVEGAHFLDLTLAALLRHLQLLDCGTNLWGTGRFIELYVANTRGTDDISKLCTCGKKK